MIQLEEKVMNILEKLGALSSIKQRFKGYRCESEGHFKLMSVCRHLSTWTLSRVSRIVGWADDFFFIPAPSSPTQGEGIQPITASSAAANQPWTQKDQTRLFIKNNSLIKVYRTYNWSDSSRIGQWNDTKMW